MLLTFEKIREIQLNEKAGELQKLPDGFFADALEYLKLKADSEEGRTAQRILSNLFERRLKKIANLASVYYSTNKSPENMGAEEQKIYSEFISALKKCDSDFKRKLYEVKTMEIKRSESERLSEGTASEDELAVNTEIPPSEDSASKGNSQKIRVKFTMDTPELMTPDMETCSFKGGEVAELPETFADFLQKRGFCLIV